MRITVDIGHNAKYDSGAVGIRKEDECTREIGLLVKEKLAILGHTIIDCSPVNTMSVGDSLMQRCNKSNNANAELFVSIHLNAFNGTTKGSEVYYYSQKGKEIASKILPELVKLGFKDRGVKYNTYYVLTNTNAVAVLIECCFIDSKEDMELYNTEKIANAIVKGITGQEAKSKKYHVVTNYIPQGEYGVEFNNLKTKYFNDIEKVHIKSNSKGLWCEIKDLPKEKAYQVHEKLKVDNLHYEVVEE